MTPSQSDELVFLPLGGSNEIGMNFNLYGYGPPHDRKWIVVDLGITFGDQTTPGIEVILPDPEFIEEHAKDVLGIVLTHAHEDHIGAVAWLWPRIKAERPEPFTVVATGGVVSLFEGATEAIDHFDPDLTIRGLLEIHRRNPRPGTR